MPDLRNLAIAAIAESGNKSPRLAALLLKLAACACDVDSDVGFFGAEAADTAGPRYLFPGFGINTSTNANVSLVIPGAVNGAPSGITIKDFTIYQVSTNPGTVTTIYDLLLVRFGGGLTVLATTGILAGGFSGTRSMSFSPVALNVGDRISVGMIISLTPQSPILASASFK